MSPDDVHSWKKSITECYAQLNVFRLCLLAGCYPCVWPSRTFLGAWCGWPWGVEAEKLVVQGIEGESTRSTAGSRLNALFPKRSHCLSMAFKTKDFNLGDAGCTVRLKQQPE